MRIVISTEPRAGTATVATAPEAHPPIVFPPAPAIVTAPVGPVPAMVLPVTLEPDPTVMHCIRNDVSTKADPVESRGSADPPEHAARVSRTHDIRADVGGERAVHLKNEDPRPVESQRSEGRQIGRSSGKRIDA
jgi:hypothetical protein